MASRGRGSGAGYPPSNNAPRQNEYFVPRDGIDREVITADICRYLGNDALVRPGTHVSDNGRQIQGYFITAYRNLTSAMIADLKNDSARWDAERRKSQSGAGKYLDSQTREGPQRGGGVPIPSGGGGNGPNAPYGGMQSSYGGNGYDNGPRYPGSEAPGYSAAGPGQGSYGPPGGYNNAPYAQGVPPQAQYAPQQSAPQDPRFGPPQMGGYVSPVGGAVHAQQQHGQDSYSSGAHYAVVSNRDPYAMDMQMTDAPVAPARRNSPPGGLGGFANPGNNNSRGAYGGAPGAMATGYGGYSAPPPPANHAAAYATPIDGGYGRDSASSNSNSGYSPAHDMTPQPPHAQQYEEPALSALPPRPPHPSSPARTGPIVSNTQAQLPITNSGQQQPAAPRHARDQRAVSERSDHRDRPERPSDRERDRDRERERERERERDATPPNRNGPPPKSGNAAPHHHYGRR